MKRLTFIVALLPLVGFAASAQADIYQWEYINPLDPSQGKRRSATLAPDGAGVDAVPGVELSGRDLTMAYLFDSELTGAYANSTILINADLSHANLSNANFGIARLTGADFTNAEINGANFGAGFCIWGLGCLRPGTGIAPAQLYSTASYQALDLTGIGLAWNDLSGGSFVGQNLTNASFVGATLTDADFRGANLSNARFATVVCFSLTYPFCDATYHATLTNANLAGADARGASYLNAFNARTANFISPDGHISGLDLGAGELLVVRDYDGDPSHAIPTPIPIKSDEQLAIGPGGTLRMVFEADAWDSTISFTPGIPVTLGGTLELTFTNDVNVASQVGRTFDLFDWTGVNPTGAFAVSSPYTWDLSHLYTTGEVTLLSIPEPASFALAAVSALSLIFNRRRKNVMRRIAFITTFLVAIPLTVLARAETLRTVALTGQQAPGTDSGIAYSTFDAHFFGNSVSIFRGPVLNDAGNVAFRGNVIGSGINSTNGLGVWSEGSGQLTLVARTGSAAPGGGNFGLLAGSELFSPTLNDAGQTAFYGALTNGNVGVWSEGSGALALVAREGTPAPGTSSGITFWFAGMFPNFKVFFDISPVLNNAGQTAFTTGLKGSGTNNTNNGGLWSQGSGSLALVARVGNPAAGMPAGVVYDFPNIATGLNDAGQIAFVSFILGSGVDSSNNVGIWSGGTGALAPVARAGNPAPDTPADVHFGTLIGPVGFNNAGKIAIQSFLAGNVDSTNDEGLWSNVSGSLKLVARRGSQAEGAPAGVNYGMFSLTGWPALNDAGQIAFMAGIEGASVDESNNEGIWSGEADDLALVARRGEHAPGTLSGVNFSDLQYPTLNSAGQIAFRGDLTGSGVTSTNDKAIWATDHNGAVQLVARSGDQLEVAPGDFRTLSDLNFTSASGNSDGRASGFNNFGQLAFWASFTDGTQGVFVSNKVATVPGDFSFDGTVDAADYVAWRNGLGTLYSQSHYDIWRSHFGQAVSGSAGATGSASASAQSMSAAIPEPSCIALSVIGLSMLVLGSRRSASSP